MQASLPQDLDCLELIERVGLSKLKNVVSVVVQLNSDLVPQNQSLDVLHDLGLPLSKLELIQSFLHVVSPLQVLVVRCQFEEPKNELKPTLEHIFLEQEQTHDLYELAPIEHGVLAEHSNDPAQ